MNYEELKQYKLELANMSEEEKLERDEYLKDLAQGKIQGPKIEYPSVSKPALRYYKFDKYKEKKTSRDYNKGFIC